MSAPHRSGSLVHEADEAARPGAFVVELEAERGDHLHEVTAHGRIGVVAAQAGVVEASLDVHLQLGQVPTAPELLDDVIVRVHTGHCDHDAIAAVVVRGDDLFRPALLAEIGRMIQSAIGHIKSYLSACRRAAMPLRQKDSASFSRAEVFRHDVQYTQVYRRRRAPLKHTYLSECCDR